MVELFKSLKLRLEGIIVLKDALYKLKSGLASLLSSDSSDVDVVGTEQSVNDDTTPVEVNTAQSVMQKVIDNGPPATPIRYPSIVYDPDTKIGKSVYDD